MNQILYRDVVQKSSWRRLVCLCALHEDDSEGNRIARVCTRMDSITEDKQRCIWHRCGHSSGVHTSTQLYQLDTRPFFRYYFGT